MTSKDLQNHRKMRAAWLAGEKIDLLQFRYNSMVKATLADGTTVIGWIVSADVDGTPPTYTIEANDGSGDVDCLESAIEEIDGPS